MILPVVQYGHPALRQKGARIERLTPEIQQIIQNLVETMYAASGIGLAAQQIGYALQVTVIDVQGVKDRPSTMEIDRQPVAFEDWMPMVLINPELQPVGDTVVGPEGCLSFPEIYADIPRSEAVDVRALDRQGQPIQFRAGGLLGRAIQHEADHLHGILFIDRMQVETKRALKPQLESLQQATKAALRARR